MKTDTNRNFNIFHLKISYLRTLNQKASSYLFSQNKKFPNNPHISTKKKNHKRKEHKEHNELSIDPRTKTTLKTTNFRFRS